MKFVKYFLILALGVLVLMQFYRPEKNQGGYETVAHFEEETQLSPALAAVFKTNCYDCHSSETIYPWYAEVAPVSYFLDEHIQDGKKHFNVSAWESYSAKKKDHKLDELIEYVEEGEMPLDSYTWLHGELSEKNTKMILDWAKIQRIKYQKEIAQLSK